MDHPVMTLGDGRTLPQLGFGVWQISDSDAPAIVGEALRAGYALVDTAADYGNEAGVGRAVRSARESGRAAFVTTKLWITDQGYDKALRGFDRSLARLGLDAVDLFLIHWPAPARNLYVETWRALVRLREDGRAKSIGVSNFTAAHLQRLRDETGVMPALNQIELHPRFQQKELREFHRAFGIATQAWSPLGQGTLLTDAALRDIASKHRKTPAQVVLRWHMDLGHGAIPKSAAPARIRENAAVFDFRLDEEDLQRIERLDRSDGRIGPHPDTFDERTLMARIGGAVLQPSKIARRLRQILSR
jgi:2,5-diketo-D-gluconate reductase A